MNRGSHRQVLDNNLAAALDGDGYLAFGQSLRCCARRGCISRLVIILNRVITGEYFRTVQQTYREGIVRRLLRRDCADDRLIDGQVGHLARIGKGAGLGLILRNRDVCYVTTGSGRKSGRLEACLADFLNGVDVTRRDAGDGHGLIVLQVDGRNAVCERNLPGAGQRGPVVSGFGQRAGECIVHKLSRRAGAVPHGDPEAEFLGLVRLNIADNQLLDRQAALILGVDDVYSGLQGDSTGDVRRTGRCTVVSHRITIRARFSHGVIEANRQTLDGNHVKVPDAGDRGLAVCEGDTALNSRAVLLSREGSAECSIAVLQLNVYREGSIGLIRSIAADDRLGHSQVAVVTLVGEGRGGRRRCDDTLLAGLLGVREVRHRGFRNGIGHVRRNAGNDHLLISLQGEVDGIRISESPVLSNRRACCVGYRYICAGIQNHQCSGQFSCNILAERHGECKLRIFLPWQHCTCDSLSDVQFTGVMFVGVFEGKGDGIILYQSRLRTGLVGVGISTGDVVVGHGQFCLFAADGNLSLVQMIVGNNHAGGILGDKIVTQREIGQFVAVGVILVICGGEVHQVDGF